MNTTRKKLDGCLESFIRMAKHPDDEALMAFAKEWGVLQLCKACGKPESHAVCRADRQVNDPTENYEELEDWRAYVRQANAMYNLAADLRDGVLASAETWLEDLAGVEVHSLSLWEAGYTPFRYTPLGPDYRYAEANPARLGVLREQYREGFPDISYRMVSDWFHKGGRSFIPVEELEWFHNNEYRVSRDEFLRDWYTRALEYWRKLLLVGLNVWMGPKYVNMTPSVRWEEGPAPAVVLTPDTTRMPGKAGFQTIFSILVLQLASAITSGDGIFRCSECERPFSLGSDEDRRRVKRGRRMFCSDLCKEEAQRRNKRESWNRNKDRWQKKDQAISATSFGVNEDQPG